MSGHSKWATIKHKKGAADARRGVRFNMLIAGNTLPNSTVMAIYHHPRQRRRRQLAATHPIQSP